MHQNSTEMISKVNIKKKKNQQQQKNNIHIIYPVFSSKKQNKHKNKIKLTKEIQEIQKLLPENKNQSSVFCIQNLALHKSSSHCD